MNLVTLDFETYFDNDYTLSKMTTEEYCRDPRFKVHLRGTKLDNQPAVVDAPITVAFFEDRAMLCHHAHFDGLILNHYYGIKPAFWFDTLSMARMVMPHLKSHSLGALAEVFGLQEKQVPYHKFKGLRDLPPDIYQELADGCAHDVELTHQIYLRLLPYMPKEELRLIDMTVRMFTEPALTLDRPLMEWYVAALAQKKEALLAQLGVTKEDLGSNEKFAAILRDLGIEPPTKISPTTQKPIYAFAKTDDGFRQLLEDDDEKVAMLAEARLETKSVGTSTRAERLLGMAQRGFLPVYLNYCGAHTLRDSGGDAVNWQNFKRIDYDADGQIIKSIDQRGMVRLSIMAPKGYIIGVVDAAQIECRLLNWLAGQTDVLDKFRNKVDIYSELATMFYGRTITKKDKAERGTGKQLELSCGYGAGAETIVRTAKLGIYGPPVELSIHQGKQARDLYRSTHPAVQMLWKDANQVLHRIYSPDTIYGLWRGILEIKNHRVYGPGGTWLDYSNLHYDAENKEYYVVGRKGKSRMYGAKLIENIIQYLARIHLMHVALQIGAERKVVMRTHDEVAALLPEARAAEDIKWMIDLMKTPPAWARDVPLDAEGGYDVRYSK